MRVFRGGNKNKNKKIKGGVNLTLLDNRYKQQFSKHVTRYEYSFLSYCKKEKNGSKFWNKDMDLTYSPSPSPSPSSSSEFSIYDSENYRLNNLLLEDGFDTTSRINYEPVYCMVNEAIDHICVFDIFADLETYIAFAELIFKIKFHNFFSFVLFVAITYGFHHNDLYSCNIVYNIRNNEIVMIDFGRSVLVVYYKEINKTEQLMIFYNLK